jgi:hypothetical protein
MTRSQKRRKRLWLPPFGNKVMGVDIPNKMQRRILALEESRAQALLKRQQAAIDRANGEGYYEGCGS